LKDIPGITLPAEAEWARHVWHLFVIRTSKRDELKDYLNNNCIQSGIHYPISLPKLQAYSYIGQGEEDMFANQSDGELLSLPIGEHLTTEDARTVAEIVKGFCINA